MNVLNRIISVIFYLVILAFGILSLIILGSSFVTTIRFRQYEQNDLFDVVRDNVPLLLLSMAAVFAVILAVQWAAGRREAATRGNIALSPERTGPDGPQMSPERTGPDGLTQMSSERTGSAGFHDGLTASRGTGRASKAAFPWAMMIFAGALSLFFVFAIHGNATNDALQLDAIMQDFARGDYSALQPGGYLYVYPFQITYVWIGVGLQAVFGPSNYLVYQILNVVSILLNLYLLYQITWELFGSRAICRVFQVLACGCVFYYVYATFVYADLWSFAVQTAALCLQVLYMKRGKLRYEIGAGVCIAAACLLKSNCYVALVAMVILLAADGVRKAVGRRSSSERTRISNGNDSIHNCTPASEDISSGDSSGMQSIRNNAGNNRNKVNGKSGRPLLINLLIALMLVLMTRGASAAVNGITAGAAGLDSFPQGVPAWNYIAMGMQEAEGKYGWYNGTNVGLYREADWDRDTSIDMAKESIQKSIGEFRNSGRYTVKFYLGKFLSQWGDPTCVSMRELEETERHVEPVCPIANSLIFGTGSRVLQWVMNVFHSMIWLGAVIFAGAALIEKIRNNDEMRSSRGGCRGNQNGHETKDSSVSQNRCGIRAASGLTKSRIQPTSAGEETSLRRNEGVLLLVLFIFGGMLFHEIWEASGRYTMRYYLTLLPLAAWGIHRITSCLQNTFRKTREITRDGRLRQNRGGTASRKHR